MTPRHLALAIAAVAVLGVGVYLFLEVRSLPAQAQASAAPQAPAVTPVASVPQPSEAPTVAAVKPPPAQPGATAPAMPDEAQTSEDSPSFDPAAPLRPTTKLDAVMDQANKAYDRQDFEEARIIAGKVLQKQPTNARMLRIMVSSSCIEGDNAAAQKYFEQLPKGDREQMKTRCDRYGVTFKDPAQ